MRSSSSVAFFLQRAQERAALPLAPGFWASSPPPPHPTELEDIINNSAVQRARRAAEAAALAQEFLQQLSDDSQPSNAEEGQQQQPEQHSRRRDRSEKSKKKEKKSTKKKNKDEDKESRRERKEKKRAKRAKKASWESTIAVDYGKALLPGEAEGYARYVQDNKRIPRRGEIGLTADQIESFERSGYVMSGARHERMNAVRERKEGQIYSAEEERALAIMKRQKQQESEQQLVESLKAMAAQQEAPTSMIKFVPRV